MEWEAESSGRSTSAGESSERDPGGSRGGWQGRSQRSAVRGGVKGFSSRLERFSACRSLGRVLCSPLLPGSQAGHARSQEGGIWNRMASGCCCAQRLQLPANSKRAAAGRGLEVQSSACFCNCFDDASACSHHYRDATALFMTTIY